MSEEVKLPEGKVVIPGVLESTPNFIEHPELVAQRLERYASVVGHEQVIFDHYADVYIAFALLEERINENLSANEGIVIVRDRKREV